MSRDRCDEEGTGDGPIKEEWESLRGPLEGRGENSNPSEGGES